MEETISYSRVELGKWEGGSRPLGYGGSMPVSPSPAEAEQQLKNWTTTLSVGEKTMKWADQESQEAHDREFGGDPWKSDKVGL